MDRTFPKMRIPCLLFLLFTLTSIQADVVQWVAPSSGSWHAAANWNGSAVPTLADDVFLPTLAAPYTVYIGGYDTAAIHPTSEAKSLLVSPGVFLDLMGQLSLSGPLNSHGAISLVDPTNGTTTVLEASSVNILSGHLYGIGTVRTSQLVGFSLSLSLSFSFPISFFV